MKSLKFFAPFILIIFMALQVSYAATGGAEGTGEYVEDTVITTKVKSALLAEQDLKSTEIKVETIKGTVHLSGLVSSNANIQKAIEVTRKVKGVRGVQNNMRLKSAP